MLTISYNWLNLVQLLVNMSLTSEQLKNRRFGIGGSDVAAIRGVSPWKTPVQLYYEKTEGYHEKETDEKAKLRKEKGIILEDWLIDKYEQRTGYKVERKIGQVAHPNYPYVRANVDGLVRDPKTIVEIKTTKDLKGFGDDGSEDIPIYYDLQVRHYMATLDAPTAHLFAYIEHLDELRLYIIPRDKKKEQVILDRIQHFWANHIVKNIPPDPVDLLDFKLLYPESILSNIEASKDIVKIWEHLRDIKNELRVLSTEEEKLKMELMGFMRMNEQLTLGATTLATWKAHKRQNFDSKKLQKEYPNIYEKYLTTSSYRTFLVK